jgi:hypothetical protein
MRSYSYLMSPGASDDGALIAVPEIKFREMLDLLLERVEVDEDWYRAAYSDVDLAVQAGTLSSGRLHYLRAGYFENRLPRRIEVDEAWYLATYPDVARAIANGAVTSAAAHFVRDGYLEGRLPHPGWSLLDRKRPL